MARVKGMVLSSEVGKAIILTTEGEYRSIKVHQSLEVGELYEDRSWPLWRRAIAAVVILALTMGALDFFRVTAYAQISGAIELGVNRWGRVITARALNEEGEQLLEKMDLKYMTMDTAVETVENAEALLTTQVGKDSGSISDVNASSGTDSDSANGNDNNIKVFPGKGADKGNKDSDAFVLKVEENMNQGYYKELEREKASPGYQTDGLTTTNTSAEDQVVKSDLDNNETDGTSVDVNDTAIDSGVDPDDGDTPNTDSAADNSKGHLDNRDGDRKDKSNNGRDK